VVLLLIDVINDLDFSGNEGLLRQVTSMAQRLAALKDRAIKHSCPVVYVNDNFGRWRSDFKSQVQHCLKDGVPGQKLAELLRPTTKDYFVLKPAHSGFYSTTLELLLKHFEAQTLILAGIATNLCVLFTANDAFLRGYHVCVPRDCVASNTAKLNRDALEQMKTTLRAEVHDSDKLPWAKWKRRASE